MKKRATRTTHLEEEVENAKDDGRPKREQKYNGLKEEKDKGTRAIDAERRQQGETYVADIKDGYVVISSLFGELCGPSS